MDYETPQHYYIPTNNSKDSDKRSYFASSVKTQRDSYFYQDSSDDYEYSYGETWK